MPERLDREWFKRRPDWISWAIALGHLGLVLVGVLGAAIAGPSPVALLAWLWFGLTFTSLLNLMHECAHRLAFRRRSSSDLFGRWVLGPLVLADFDAYRERHWAHHRNLGLDGDTKDAYLVDIRGGGFVGLLVRCLCLREAVRKFTQTTPDGGEELPVGQGMGFSSALARTVLVQAALISSILAAAAASHDGVARIAVSVLVAYGFVYLYGLASITVFAATLRAIAEHQIGEADRLNEGRAALRNFPPGVLPRLVFGSYGFANHATHHREPGIPHYRLCAVTSTLVAAEPALAPSEGYLVTLWQLARSRRAPAVLT